METQLIIAKRIGYLTDDPVFEEVEILKKKLLNFIKYTKLWITRSSHYQVAGVFVGFI